jgi:sensor histidine kinase YesM
VILDKEINTLENHLELQRIRYSGKFDYRIQIADEIDIDSMKIHPMLVKPFIENAIEHGIKHREIPDHIDIRFSLNDQMLVFEVEDDGIGRQKAREISILKDPEHRSMATSLTIERLEHFTYLLVNKMRWSGWSGEGWSDRSFSSPAFHSSTLRKSWSTRIP